MHRSFIALTARARLALPQDDSFCTAAHSLIVMLSAAKQLLFRSPHARLALPQDDCWKF